jgi:hypothetical protein
MTLNTKSTGAARCSAIGSLGSAMLAGAIGLTATADIARAEVVVFDNTAGTFNWKVSISDLFEVDYGSFLDITQPPTQSGERKSGSFGRWLGLNVSGGDPTVRDIVAVGDSEVADIGYQIEVDWNGMTLGTHSIREYDAGEYVDSSAAWRFGCQYFLHLPFSTDLNTGTPLISTLAYLGVKRVVGNQINYGWILLKDYTKPVIWAYETEPNTPIQIPVPTPAGLAVGGIVGVFASLRRSRR